MEGTIGGLDVAAAVALAGSALTAIMSLIVVYMANRNARRIISDQLAADTRERTKDRRLNARRQVYLELARATDDATSHLALIPTLDPRKENLAIGLRGLTTVSMQAQLICEFETAVKIDAFVRITTEALFESLRSSRQMHDTLIALENCEKECAVAEADERRQSLLIDNAYEAGLPPDLGLVQNHANTRNRKARLYDERSDICALRANAHREISKSMQPLFLAIAVARVRMFAALRVEFEGTANELEFEKMLESNVPHLERMMGWVHEPVE